MYHRDLGDIFIKIKKKRPTESGGGKPVASCRRIRSLLEALVGGQQSRPPIRVRAVGKVARCKASSVRSVVSGEEPDASRVPVSDAE